MLCWKALLELVKHYAFSVPHWPGGKLLEIFQEIQMKKGEDSHRVRCLEVNRQRIGNVNLLLYMHQERTAS